MKGLRYICMMSPPNTTTRQQAVSSGEPCNKQRAEKARSPSSSISSASDTKKAPVDRDGPDSSLGHGVFGGGEFPVRILRVEAAVQQKLRVRPLGVGVLLLYFANIGFYRIVSELELDVPDD